MLSQKRGGHAKTRKTGCRTVAKKILCGEQVRSKKQGGHFKICCPTWRRHKGCRKLPGRASQPRVEAAGGCGNRTGAHGKMHVAVARRASCFASRRGEIPQTVGGDASYVANRPGGCQVISSGRDVMIYRRPSEEMRFILQTDERGSDTHLNRRAGA